MVKTIEEVCLLLAVVFTILDFCISTVGFYLRDIGLLNAYIYECNVWRIRFGFNDYVAITLATLTSTLLILFSTLLMKSNNIILKMFGIDIATIVGITKITAVINNVLILTLNTSILLPLLDIVNVVLIITTTSIINYRLMVNWLRRNT